MNLFLLVSAVSATQVNFEEFDPEFAGEFIRGFFTGATNGATQCNVAAGQSVDSFYKLVQDVKNYDNSYIQILTDLTYLKQELLDLNTDCNIPSLILQIHKILGPAGKGMVMRNYMLNMAKITQDFTQIQSCSTNFYTCGQSAGDIFRLITGYKIKLEALEDFHPTQDLIQVIQGFVSTAELGSGGNCKKFEKTFSDLSKLRSDVLGVAEKNIEDQIKVLQIVLDLWMNDEDVVDCAMQYGGVVLYAIPYFLSSAENWKVAYEYEGDSLNNLFNQLVSSCHKDYHSCGAKLGYVYNTVASYA